jgi:hypothetical protein
VSAAGILSILPIAIMLGRLITHRLLMRVSPTPVLLVNTIGAPACFGLVMLATTTGLAAARPFSCAGFHGQHLPDRARGGQQPLREGVRDGARAGDHRRLDRVGGHLSHLRLGGAQHGFLPGVPGKRRIGGSDGGSVLWLARRVERRRSTRPSWRARGQGVR